MFSYESCLSTNFVTSSLQLLLARGWEWQDQAPVYIFNGDVEAAFDNMLYREALKVGFYELQSARDTYRLAAGEEGSSY